MRFDLSRYSILIGSLLISLSILGGAYVIRDGLIASSDDEEDTTMQARMAVGKTRAAGDGLRVSQQLRNRG